MVYAYMRQAPDLPQLATQHSRILAYALKKELSIDKEVVEYATKNLPLVQRAEFETFLQTMEVGNTVIVSSMYLLSDKEDEIIKIINCMLSHSVNLWLVDADLLMNKETNMVDIFPLLYALRKEEKEKTSYIGRPKGSKSSSKFDIHRGEIITLLSGGMNVSAIARELGVTRSSLKDYIESRGIRDLIDGAWVETSGISKSKEMDNIVLVCPFEEDKKRKEKMRRA